MSIIEFITVFDNIFFAIASFYHMESNVVYVVIRESIGGNICDFFSNPHIRNIVGNAAAFIIVEIFLVYFTISIKTVSKNNRSFCGRNIVKKQFTSAASAGKAVTSLDPSGIFEL